MSNNRNTSDVFFIEGPGAYLAGTLSALMAERRSSGKRPVAISMVGSYPDVNENVASTFKWGAKVAVPGIKVFEDYSYDLSDPSKFERLANHQIDRRSVVVFADAGACSAGALSAAVTRGVWGVAADQDPSHVNLGAGILGYTVKNFGQEVDSSIRSYLNHTLEHGHFDIGIEVRAVDFVPTNLVPPSIRARLERVRQQRWRRWANLPKVVNWRPSSICRAEAASAVPY